MSDVAIAEPRRPVPSPHNRPKRPVRLPEKLQTALKAIIWEGQELDEAASTAGLTTHAVRCSLAKPHVVAWMKGEREVLRAYVSAQNIHRAKQIRDAADNMPAMHAIRYIDGEAEAASRGNSAQTPPGVTIRIVNVVQAEHAVAPMPVTVEAIPSNSLKELPNSYQATPLGQNGKFPNGS